MSVQLIPMKSKERKRFSPQQKAFTYPLSFPFILSRREKIAELAEKSGLFVLEDDTFGSLLQEKIKPVSSLIPEQSFYFTSFSKGIAPALRVGYVVPPEKFHQRVLTGLKITTWMASPIMVEIISGWIKDGNADRLISLQTHKIAQRVSILHTNLKHFSIRSHPHCPHAWLKLPSSIRENEAVLVLSRNGIDVTPGEYFSVGNGFIPGGLRLCLGQVDNLNILEKACRIIFRTLSQAPGIFGADI